MSRYLFGFSVFSRVMRTYIQPLLATQSWRLCGAHAHPGCLLRTPDQDVLDAAETSSYSCVQFINLCVSLKQIRLSLC